MKKKLLAALLLAAISVSTLCGCGVGSLEDAKDVVSAVKDEVDKKSSEDADEADAEDKDSKEDKKSDSKDEGEDDGILVAGTVDTSSKFAFDIKNALIGTDPYRDDVFIVYVIGEFENNSDDVMDFSHIVDVDVKQDGFELDQTYTRGLQKLSYAEIKPGESIPVILAYKILSGQDDVEITAVDRTHYAKQVLFEGSFTIDELIENTNNAIDDYNDIISNENNDEIDSL